MKRERGGGRGRGRGGEGEEERGGELVVLGRMKQESDVFYHFNCAILQVNIYIVLFVSWQ